MQTAIKFHENHFDESTYLQNRIAPVYKTDLGALFAGDCRIVMSSFKDEVVDTVFADPPFNIGKEYRKQTNDNLQDDEYIKWCKGWIDECVRVLKTGGSLFLYNLPKWNMILGGYLLSKGLEFRHWIAIEQGACFPIPKKLHPSHYSLLYFTKGKPKTFRKIRTPIEICRHCGGEIKDYGGHRKAMNPNGVGLKDIWIDIPPVRHRKFKSENRKANALSTKLLDRVIEISTNPGELVLDPFGGSGTTYDCCEKKERQWLGIEIDYTPEIISRLENRDIMHHKNNDYVED